MNDHNHIQSIIYDNTPESSCGTPSSASSHLWPNMYQQPHYQIMLPTNDWTQHYAQLNTATSTTNIPNNGLFPIIPTPIVDLSTNKTVDNIVNPWNCQLQNDPNQTPYQQSEISDDGEITTCPDDLKEFIKIFKQKRIQLGINQAEVGMALGARYGSMFSQTTICRFETHQLSEKNMHKLKPLLFKWLEEAGSSSSSPTHVYEKMTQNGRKRKRRTSIEVHVRLRLEYYFQRNQKPNTQELERIAMEVRHSRNMVRVWFCNRRQKQRRLNPQMEVENQMNYAQYAPYTF